MNNTMKATEFTATLYHKLWIQDNNYMNEH